MTPQRTYDASGLPVYSISTQAPLWWGQLLMAAIEGTMFCILMAMYFYLRLSVDTWPPPGIRLPALTLPTIGLAALVLSSLGSYLASEGAKRNDRRLMLRGMVLNVALAAVFFVARGIEWRSFNFTWESDAYGSIVWAILFLHSLDAVADIIYTLVLIVIVASGRCGPKQRLGVHVDSVVWYFIVLIWIPFYAIVYWGPRVLGSPK